MSKTSEYDLYFKGSGNVNDNDNMTLMKVSHNIQKQIHNMDATCADISPMIYTAPQNQRKKIVAQDTTLKKIRYF